MLDREADTAARRSSRPLRLAVLAAVLVELLYVVGANLFLNSDWGQSKLNRRPEKLAMQWQVVWTLVPGLVHFEGLELRGRARRASWRARLSRGRLYIWLPSLFNRHLRLLSGAATGSSVEVDSALPPAGSRPERRKRGWRISIDRLDLADVERLRFGRYRIEGAGRLRGAASFEVRGPMAFEFTELSFHDARILAAGVMAADSLTLDAVLDVEETTIGDTTIADLLAGASGDIELVAEASNLGFLTAYLGRFPWIDIDGIGHLAVDLEMTDGWLAPGSSLDFEGPMISASYLGFRASGAGRVRGRVPEGAGHVLLEAELDSYGVERRADGEQLLEGRALSVVVTNDSTAIDRPAQGVAVAFRLPPARVLDMAALDPYVPGSTGLALAGGEAEISADIDYSAAERGGQGWLRFEGRRIVADFDDSRVQANVVLDARFPSVELEAGILTLDGTALAIDRVRLQRDGEMEESDWSARLRVPAGTLTREFASDPPEPAVVSGTLEAELVDTTPLTAVIRDRAPKLAWFDELLTVENVELESGFRLAGPEVRLEGLVISGGAEERLEILAELDLRKRSVEGVVFVGWRLLTAAVMLGDDGRDWKLTRSRRWYTERAAEYRAARDDPGTDLSGH